MIIDEKLKEECRQNLSKNNSKKEQNHLEYKIQESNGKYSKTIKYLKYNTNKIWLYLEKLNRERKERERLENEEKELTEMVEKMRLDKEKRQKEELEKERQKKLNEEQIKKKSKT